MGKPLSATDTTADKAGSRNPFRYRGYCWDEETGLYYANSRYYDPETGRFVNADRAALATSNPLELTDKNLYVYCDNNSVMRKDEYGNVWVEAVIIGAVAGLAGQYAGDVLGNIASGKSGIDIFKMTSPWTDYLASGIGGAIAAIPASSIAGTMAVGAAGNVASDTVKGKIGSARDLAKSALWGAFANAVGYKVSEKIAAKVVKKVDNIPRTAQKRYINNNIYRGRQANINVNYHAYMSNTTKGKIKLVQNSLKRFRAGIYSTLTSTVVGVFRV